MRLTYIAHACFKLEVAGKTIIFDPYKKGAFSGAVGYGPVNESADIVLISHGHEDHNASSEVSGYKRLINSPGIYDFDEFLIEGISSFHDDKSGMERGENIVFTVKSKDCSLAHLGDQGVVDRELINKIKDVSAFLVPVGGTYTLGPHEATEFVNLLGKGKVIIPMHYKTEKLGFPIKDVDEFLSLNKDKKQIRIEGASVDLSQNCSFDDTVIIVLRMSRL